MPDPSTPILDTFPVDGGPPPPGGHWANYAGINGLIVSGGLLAPSVPGVAGGYWNEATSGCCENYVLISDISDGELVFLIARGGLLPPSVPFSTGYWLVIERDDVGGDVVVLFAGPAFLAGANIVLNAGDSFWLKCDGDSIIAYQKPVGGTAWLPVVSATDSTTPSGGYIGVVLVGTDVRLGSFGGGSCVVPVACPTSPPVAYPSHHRSTGLSIIAEDPLMKAERGWSARLTDQIQSYSHEIRAIGGYWSAEVNINDRQDHIEDWIQNGLGRHIRVFDDALVQCFEGFVNKITAKLGPMEFTLGPLLDGGNQVAYVYSTVDNSTNPPTMGERAKTAYADDAASQALYGIIQRVESTGGATAALAAQNRDTFIAEHAWPPTSRRSTLLGGSAGDLTLEILGYWHWLTVYVYNQTINTGEVGVSTKLVAVLAAQPNAGLFSTDYARITPNAVLVPQYENDDRTAEDIIKGLNSVGSATFARMNCGFYNNRQFIYEPAPQEIRYVQRITSNGAQTDLIGGPIDPWRVRPDGYIFYADFLAGRIPPVTPAMLKTDPRCGHVEVVQYTAPYGLDVDGVTTNTLDQMLARQGLAGTGA